MSLSDIAVRRAKPTDKPFKLADGGGMYLLVHPNGSKYWRLKYRFAGKEKSLALGIYPHISLTVARDKRDDAKKLLAIGSDPGEQKQVKKIEDRQRSANTFEAVAREWLTKQAVTWTPKSTQRITRLLERNIFPSVGSSPIAQVTAAGFLTSLQKIEMRGNFETAHRAMQICGRIFRYAIATGRAQADLSLVLKGALTPVKEKHHASITNPKNIKDLLIAMEGYSGAFITKMALRLSPLLFVRPGELRHAEWSEIDLNAAEWRIGSRQDENESGAPYSFICTSIIDTP